uniref:Death domain-containing protein n=1 Tax=Amphimedon queenslandica TaxID=400682 RepID=A0A1X7UWC5_AMPQE
MPSKYHQLKRWRSSATRPYVVLVPYVSFPVWTVVQTFHDLKKKSKRKKEFYQQQLLQEKAVLTQQLDNANTLLEQAEKDKSTLKLDYEKLRTEVAFNEAYITKILEEKTQVEEKKQIITEDYEKLKLKVASDTEEQYINDVQNLKTEVSEKDKVIAKLTSKVEEQLQNEKQIITDLRAKVSDNELYTTKLMKEKSQLQERVTSLEEQSIKETRSIGQQFNLEEEQKNPPFSRFLILIYLLFISFVLTANYNSKQFIAPLPGVEIDASINQLVAGGSHTQLHWEEYGLTLEVPPDALPCGFIAEIAAYKNDVFSALIECLHKWLLRNDKVDDKGGPTLTSLKNALRENGQKAVAENIMKF